MNGGADGLHLANQPFTFTTLLDTGAVGTPGPNNMAYSTTLSITAGAISLPSYPGVLVIQHGSGVSDMLAIIFSVAGITFRTTAYLPGGTLSGTAPEAFGPVSIDNSVNQSVLWYYTAANPTGTVLGPNTGTVQAAVPEPASALLAGLGLALFGFFAGRKRRKG